MLTPACEHNTNDNIIFYACDNPTHTYESDLRFLLRRHQLPNSLSTKKSIFPHTIEILQYLKDKSYELHLITNGFEKTQWHKVKNSQIDHFFTHMITSEISNSMKPNREIFEYALQKTNATKETSIMIGDNLEADIMGAINFGMDCIFVNHINAVTDIQPTYTITHLIELETIF